MKPRIISVVSILILSILTFYSCNDKTDTATEPISNDS